jgi:hypothetical protein
MSEQPPLPNFLIVGAARAGTTSLARYLEVHPDAFIPLMKEVDFFDREDNYRRGVDWYRSHFAGGAGKTAIGEASPYYMLIPDAVPRMASLLPDARLIVLLRNPVDRAYSHYWMRRCWKVEKRGFRTAVTEESAGSARVPEYLPGGMYCAQLKHICKYYPRDAVHIVLFEDLRRDPGLVFAEACRFLGIDPNFVPPNLGVNHNPNYSFRSVRLWWWLNRWRQKPGVMRQLTLNIDRFNLRLFRYPPMDAITRGALLDWFQTPNRQLEEWLGRKLTEWER